MVDTNYQDMVYTFFKEEVSHALERCHCERTKTTISRGLSAELILHFGVGRAVQYLQDNRTQVDQSIQAAWPGGVPGVIPPPSHLPLADRSGNRRGVGEAAEGTPSLGSAQTTQSSPAPGPQAQSSIGSNSSTHSCTKRVGETKAPVSTGSSWMP